MTNFERWHFYCKDIKSPEIFLDFGFYALIAAALQRRVWRGSERHPLFPNLYTIFIAPPAVGKGLVLGEIDKVLRYWRLTEEELRKDALFGSMQGKPGAKGKIELPLLIHVGPRSIGFERLVYEMSKNIRSFFYGPPEAKRLYTHCSIAIVLEELDSLLKKNSEDVVAFLREVYDCKDNYERATFDRDVDDVRRCCLNLVAGATPEHIKRLAVTGLISQGLASRTLFVYGTENRFARCKPPEFNEEQVTEYNKLLLHIKAIAGLFGEVKFTKEAEQYLEYWAEHTVIEERKTIHPKIRDVHSRKEVTVQKLAMTIHFGETTEMELTLPSVTRAVELANKAEKYMLEAFVGISANPLAEVTDEVLTALKKSKAGLGKTALWLMFNRDLPQGKKSLDELVEFLLATKQIKADGSVYKI